jgi:hypothetical protein
VAAPLVHLKVEDFPTLAKASGGEVEKLFRALNQLTTYVSTALDGGFTLTSNSKAFSKAVDLNGMFPVKIANGLGAKPLAVLVTSAMDTTDASPGVPAALGPVAWSTTGDQVVISAVSGMTAGRKYRTTLLVLG